MFGRLHYPHGILLHSLHVVCARYITSDTASAASAVADEFDDTDQVDCELHIINLVLEYGIGLRENTSTKQGIKSVVTPGGELSEGKEIIRKMSKIADFISTPQRKQELEKFKSFTHCQ